MAQKSSALERFWQELKRRKVFKVATMYAGTAFIILEAVNNLVGPLRLPEWTPTLIIVLLGVLCAFFECFAVKKAFFNTPLSVGYHQAINI